MFCLIKHQSVLLDATEIKHRLAQKTSDVFLFPVFLLINIFPQLTQLPVSVLCYIGRSFHHIQVIDTQCSGALTKDSIQYQIRAAHKNITLGILVVGIANVNAYAAGILVVPKRDENYLFRIEILSAILDAESRSHWRFECNELPILHSRSSRYQFLHSREILLDAFS